MVNIVTLPLGAYQTNCYIVSGEGSDRCIVIDPGYESGEILKQTQGKTVAAILLTHGHFDHVGGVSDLAAKTGCRVYICPEDLSMPPQMTNGPIFYTDTYGEGDVLTLADISLKILHTPGHTPGSVCILAEDVLFTGDTLFQDSCGRTDLPGGNWATITQCLGRLAALEGNFWVFPGHGGSTTLDAYAFENCSVKNLECTFSYCLSDAYTVDMPRKFVSVFFNHAQWIDKVQACVDLGNTFEGVSYYDWSDNNAEYTPADFRSWNGEVAA